jgi:hypothetical protein
MRTIIAFASALVSSAALADSVRHLTVPERLWRTWAPSADLCRDSKATFVVSAKGYETSQASCTIQWVNRGRRRADLLRPYALLEPSRAARDDGRESGHCVE